MRLFSRTLAAGLAAGAVILTCTATALSATGSGADPAPAEVAAGADRPPSAVEDYAYPNADEILAERGILLKRGNGHLVLADCDSGTDLLEVLARDNVQDTYCFRATGRDGYLSLELPSVYGVRGNDYQTEVTMTVDDEEKTYEVEENQWTPVGESADPEGREHMLVEITTNS